MVQENQKWETKYTGKHRIWKTLHKGMGCRTACGSLYWKPYSTATCNM